MGVQNIPWNLINVIAKRPNAQRSPQGYTFFASDTNIGYVNVRDPATGVKTWRFLGGNAIKLTKTGLTPAASFDLTSTPLGNNPPVGALLSLRVTGATTGTFVGTYILTDAAGDMLTAATHTVVGVARISDDHKTITFPTPDVTGFVIQYIPGGASA